MNSVKNLLEKNPKQLLLSGVAAFFGQRVLYIPLNPTIPTKKMSSVPISLGSDGIKQPASASRATGSDSKDFTLSWT